MPARAADNNGADVQVFLNLGKHRRQFRDHFQVHGVADVGSVEGDEQGGALLLQ